MEHTIDATNQNVGRLSTEIAGILQGKKSPDYDPRLASNNKVVIKNIRKITIPASKEEGKLYHRHTGYMGHLKTATLKQVVSKKGKAEVLRRAVKQMLPKNRLQNLRMKNLIIEE
ncbi:50S ribosomal protein L13 [Candidatus Wolfebacteria bacterium CG10_big_fil_rev_8_21_14_0_10_31_9]|uniref:50S ribosomal protein L13 n=1 Tax=Candidatus Wolfebacteria bacterium CG10_big_fil_rev_8_21_14_0_10_31_9 TaxID=1975070 RepID=A0A2H0RBR8_9BACT|nr:MAG: 50S ribosomal protein L13 [Candidatus Wolfebacteria bacterium CG10_big_fil_rev_8_21_14_0_10_31_9]